MSKAGYHTVAISANGWITEESGFAAGFDEFRSVMSSRHKTLGSSSWRDRARWVIEGSRAALDDGAAEIAQVIAARLSERKPIFCFVNLVECHSPYLPPKPHNSLGWAERLRATRDANRYCTFEAFWLQAFGRTEVPESSTQRMRTLYGDSIRQLDSWTEQVLSMLDGARLLGDTQVIVTSDHGENFGEGGLTGHTFSLDDRLIRIPFVTAGPLDLAAGPVLTLADVPRLLADAAGIPEHPWLEAPADSGVAVAQFPAPARRGDPDVERRVNELQLDQAALDKVCRGFDCATDGNLKILRDDEGEELVDLINDPLEVKPIRLDLAAATAHGEQVARLRRALDRAAAESLDGLIEAPESVVPSSENEKAALERQMRLMGYL
jgi:arylsulfatase A-like enzyme